MTIAVYLRVSHADTGNGRSRPSESASIESQRRIIYQFISQHPEFAHAQVTEFCDDGWSGRNFQRPAVQKLLQQAKSGAIQCMIVKDLSRFGRNYLEVGNYISYVFPFLGVRFLSVNDRFDSLRPMEADSLEVSLQTLLSDNYSRDLSRKVKSAMMLKAQRGEFISPYAPYGYKKDTENKNRILPDSGAAENVRRIFSMAADGQSTRQIARRLNAEQVLTPMQYKQKNGCTRMAWNCVRETNFWTQETVLKILRDERYTGKAIYGKTMRDEVGSRRQVQIKKGSWVTVAKAHEPVIPQQLFDCVQEQLRSYTPRGKVHKGQNPLLRKVHCGICGHAMIRTKGKQPYFACCTPLVAQKYSCPESQLPEADLLCMVKTSIRIWALAVTSQASIRKEVKRCVEQKSLETKEKQARLQQSLARQEYTMRTLYENFAFGAISKTEYLTQKNIAEKKRSQIEGQLEQLSNQILEAQMESAQMENAACTDAVAFSLLQDVVVYPNKRLHIVWGCCEGPVRSFLQETPDSRESYRKYQK